MVMVMVMVLVRVLSPAIYYGVHRYIADLGRANPSSLGTKPCVPLEVEIFGDRCDELPGVDAAEPEVEMIRLPVSAFLSARSANTVRPIRNQSSS